MFMTEFIDHLICFKLSFSVCLGRKEKAVSIAHIIIDEGTIKVESFLHHHFGHLDEEMGKCHYHIFNPFWVSHQGNQKFLTPDIRL